MKVVCDTNVVVSGFLFGGNPREILRLASQHRFTNYTSPAMLREVEDVLSRPKFGLHPDQLLELLNLIRDSFEIVTPRQTVQEVEADPDDDRVLETAAEAKADLIISGDRHLLALKQWRNIPIVTPADFITQFFPPEKQVFDPPS